MSGSLGSGNNSLNIRPLFAGYPFQGTSDELKKSKKSWKVQSFKSKPAH